MQEKINLLDFLNTEEIEKIILTTNVYECESSTMLPLYDTKVFETFFINNPELFKMFLIDVLKLELDYNEVEINIYKEFEEIKQNNDAILILISIDAKFSLMAELSYKGEGDKKIYSLDLNTNNKSSEVAEDILVLYSKKRKVIIDNRKVFYYEFLKKHRDLYYRGIKNKDTIWLTLLSSQTYYEAYNILLNMFDDEWIEKILSAIYEVNKSCYSGSFFEITVRKIQK